MSDVAPLVSEETHAEEERKTSYLELFCDLVFVFAFTQVTALILEDTSVEGFLRERLFGPGQSVRWDELVEQATGAPLSVASLERAMTSLQP